MPGIGMGISLSKSGGSPVTPLSLFGASLGLWYHYDDRVDVTGVTSQWNDLSGNGRHATQPVAGDRPTPDPTAFGGRGGLRFSASAEWLETPALTLGTGAFTVFMSMKADLVATSAAMIYYESGPNAYSGPRNNVFAGQESIGPKQGDTILLGGDSANYVFNGKTTANSTANRSLIHVYDTGLIGVDQAKIYENTLLISDSTAVAGIELTGNLRASIWYIGARSSGLAPVRGVIREFGIITRAITAPEIAALYAYQRSDSGL